MNAEKYYRKPPNLEIVIFLDIKGVYEFLLEFV